MVTNRPAFLITIDTEGDNLWSRPRVIETRNAEFVGRFQSLCEDFDFKPTWLTNHEMAMCPKFVHFGRDVLRRKTGEVGMHLHAWNCPPIYPLTDDDFYHQPFLIEYSAEIIERKISHMTDLLQDRFETEIVSHRAGRWALDATYAKLLVKYGYRVDCSVTPHVSWADTLGSPTGQGGTDYSHFPSDPYFMDLEHIERGGSSPLLELPATVMPAKLYRIAPWMYSMRGVRRYAWKYQPMHRWLYPDGTNLTHMLAVVQGALESRRPYIEFVLHSSEFMPGGSETFRDEAAIESLYGDLNTLFSAIAQSFVGMTLSEFRTEWVARQRQTESIAWA